MTGHGYSGPMDHPADRPHVLGSDARVTALEDQVRELRRDLEATATEAARHAGQIDVLERDLDRLAKATLRALESVAGALRGLQNGVDAAMDSAHRHHEGDGT